MSLPTTSLLTIHPSPLTPLSPQSFKKLCQISTVGKRLPEALYVHVSAISALDPALQAYEQRAHHASPQVTQQVAHPIDAATLVKFNFATYQIIYLFYPDFDTDPHPALQCSIQVNLTTLEANQRDYSTTDNPPILHRKETFVTSDYPHHATFAHLTQQEEVLSLLDNSRTIGFRKAWEKRL